MLDPKGNLCEYDDYHIPEQMPDSPEREELHRQAVKEGKRILEEMRRKYEN